MRPYWEHIWKVTSMQTEDTYFPSERGRAKDITSWCPLPVALDRLIELRRHGYAVWLERKS
jgi:hypothetical protein